MKPIPRVGCLFTGSVVFFSILEDGSPASVQAGRKDKQKLDTHTHTSIINNIKNKFC